MDDLDSAVVGLANQLVNHLVPLFKVATGKRPALIGTAALVKGVNRLFLVTARHVIDHARTPGSLHFYTDEKKLRRVTGRVLFTSSPGTGHDSVDVAIVVLPQDTPHVFPGVWKAPIPLDQLVAEAVPKHSHQYLTVGFPASRSHADPSRNQLKVEPHGFRTIAAGPAAYRTLGLSPDTHIVMPLDIENMHFPDGTVRPAPFPRGMSGAPLWLLFDEDGGNDPSRTPVMGTVIEYHKDHRLLVATQASVALELLRAGDA